MNSAKEADETLDGTTRSSVFDIESILAPQLASGSYIQNTNSKLTAKVLPFTLRENDPMEPVVSQQDDNLQKAPTNQSLPALVYPVPSPLALAANLHMYSLWSQANMINWPLYFPNPVLTQQIRPTKTDAPIQPPNLNVTQTVRGEDGPASNDSSFNSNSATESLFAASECHLAVLRDEDGDTPLHIAIVHGNQRLIQKLIGLITFSKLTLDTPNHLSQTPLHLAVLTDQPEVVQQLVSAGADVNMQDRNGQTAVHMAAEKGFFKCLMQIFVASRNNTLKKRQIKLEIKNFEGFTPLHVAVRRNNKPIVEVLIYYGANVNTKDGKSGHTPLHHAVDYESPEILQLLVSKGANVNKANYSGITAIQSANSSRNEAVSKILVSPEATTTGPGKYKTLTPDTITTSTNTENRTEIIKRSTDSPSSSSKRPRVNNDK